MPVDLSDEDRQRAIASLRRYAEEAMDAPIGDLAAGLLLDFVLAEIGPSIYNRALADAQRHLAARLADLDVEIGEEEFPYWAGRR